jgi:hypothetical protein
VVQEEEDSIPFLVDNLDVLTHRFRNQNQNVRASTLKVYKSRVKHSIEDFRAWSADPFLWERELTQKKKHQGVEKRREGAASKRASKQTVAPTDEASAPIRASQQIRLPLRPDVSIEITIPAEGLKIKDLHRIGMFLLPYCEDVDPMKVPWSGVIFGSSESKN